MNESDEPRPNLSRRRGGRRAVPTILQMEATECGAACLAMILAHYGRWVPLEELRVRCGVSRDGSKAVSMLRAARELGFKARGFRRDPGRLFDLPFPMIVFWNFNHFIVLEGIRRGSAYINDPAEGPRRISMQEFDEGFTGVCLVFEPTPQFRRGGARPNLLRGLFARLGRARSPLLFVILVTLALLVPGLAVPTFSKVFVDEVLIGRSETLVEPLLIGLGIVTVLQGLLTWFQQHCLARMETKLSLVATSHFFWHVMTLPMAFFSQRFAGDIANRVASNDNVARIVSGELATNTVNMLTMAAYAGVMLAYDVTLALVVFTMAVANLLALRLVSRARENASRRLLKEQGKVAGASVSGLSMIETLKANGTEGDLFSRLAGMHTNVVAAQQDLGRLTNLLNVVPPLLTALTTVVILGLGGLRLLEGALTVGGLVAFQSLARSFSQPIEGLIQFGANLQTVKADIARLDDVLNYTPDQRIVRGMNRTDDTERPRGPGFVTLDNVTFGYNRQEGPLIENFSLEINPGQRVALVGGSGSGKSTVGKLVCGLLKPWSGNVLIDDDRLQDLSPTHIAEIVSYVDQEIILFEGSVRDNITLWNSTIDSHQVAQALRDAAILNDIMTRPNKYDAKIEEGGRNLSGGQRQRLEIARALASDPRIIVFDEATAALDPATEMEIDNNLRQRGCTCLIIAHRLSTIRDADRIVVLDGGRVVQEGRHDELIKADGLYRTLITSS